MTSKTHNRTSLSGWAANTVPQVGEVWQPVATAVGALQGPRGRCEVCMCRFGTHTSIVSRSLDDIEVSSRRVIATERPTRESHAMSLLVTVGLAERPPSWILWFGRDGDGGFLNGDEKPHYHPIVDNETPNRVATFGA